MIAVVVLASQLAGCGDGASIPRGDRGALRTSACAAAGAPDRCLRLVEQAAEVTSLHLTATIPNQVRESCLAAARGTALKVVCPTVVPVGGVISDRQLSGPGVVNRQSYSISINNGQNPGHIHWEIGATQRAARQLWVFDRANWDTAPPKQPATRVSRRRYLGRLVTLWRFPDSDGQLEGHDAAFATKDGISYFVSIHGHNHDDADIAMLLAILAHAP